MILFAAVAVIVTVVYGTDWLVRRHRRIEREHMAEAEQFIADMRSKSVRVRL